MVQARLVGFLQYTLIKERESLFNENFLLLNYFGNMSTFLGLSANNSPCILSLHMCTGLLKHHLLREAFPNPIQSMTSQHLLLPSLITTYHHFLFICLSASLSPQWERRCTYSVSHAVKWAWEELVPCRVIVDSREWEWTHPGETQLSLSLVWTVIPFYRWKT